MTTILLHPECTECGRSDLDDESPCCDVGFCACCDEALFLDDAGACDCCAAPMCRSHRRELCRACDCEDSDRDMRELRSADYQRRLNEMRY